MKIPTWKESGDLDDPLSLFIYEQEPAEECQSDIFRQQLQDVVDFLAKDLDHWKERAQKAEALCIRAHECLSEAFEQDTPADILKKLNKIGSEIGDFHDEYERNSLKEQ